MNGKQENGKMVEEEEEGKKQNTKQKREPSFVCLPGARRKVDWK